jgi:insulysin
VQSLVVSFKKDFCEHMCFLGSVKYPGENEYKSYLAQHGGHSNASTSMHFTTYKFDVLAEHAEHAIDIFANFFIEPLFTTSGTSREVHAVDSENSKNLSADVRRRLQVLKDIGDPNHYYTKFSTGNAQTLPTQTPEQLKSVREALLAFHLKHYRPENLTVVIAGPQSLDQLQKWIVSRFASMKARQFPMDQKKPTIAESLIDEAARDVPSYHFTAPEAPFLSAFHPDVHKAEGFSWPIMITTKPVRSMRKMVLMFPVPAVYKVPDQSPVSILSHLLGHEGPRTSFAILQNMGWISSLSAGSRVAAPDFTLFQIDLSLTVAGEQHWKDVANVVFQHCQLINRIVNETRSKQNTGGSIKTDMDNNNDLIRIWDEKARLGSMFFHQTSPGDVYSFVPSLCNSIVLYGTKNCLAAGSMINEKTTTFPHDLLAQYSSLLNPSNCMIERCSDTAWSEMEDQYNNSSMKIGVVEKKKEPWYGIDYFLSQLDVSDVQTWSDVSLSSKCTTPFYDAREQLELPQPNNYIPQSLELCSELPEEAKLGPRIHKAMDPPDLIVDDEKIGRLWHRLDDRYALPKSCLTLLIRNAAVENIKVDGMWQYDCNAAVYSSLLTAIFSEALAQETYDASMAGLNWNLSLSSNGVKLFCSGFSDRLPDLASKVLHEFLSNHFLKESYFCSAKDRLVRNLRSYFESRRADAHAMYYRDFLLSSGNMGIDQALQSVQLATLESIKAHHHALLVNTETIVDCLFSGNVSADDAKLFFTSASKKLLSVNEMIGMNSKNMWYPGSQERRLLSGDSIELHFASKNTQEENGSVIVTYQSSIPGYRGPDLSSNESLQSSAVIRLLCHILREPLFDELRTKQTLGYIVSSYYDVSTSSAPPSVDGSHWTVPVDYIIISVLSRKLSPPEVLQRIDDFLLNFRKTLVQLSDSEIHNYATALGTTLLKPIQKLGVESAIHFSKIERFAPEIQGTSIKMPWDNAKLMACTIQSLSRTDIVEGWDRMFLTTSGKRIVSCVYGTTFPLHRSNIKSGWRRAGVVVDDLSDIVTLRKQLRVYDSTTMVLPQSSSLMSLYRHSGWSKMPQYLTSTSGPASLGLATLLGVGVVATGWSLMYRSKRNN